MTQTIALLCGGQSIEHDISLLSTANVLRGLDQVRFSFVIIYITREGQWLYFKGVKAFIAMASAMSVDLTCGQAVYLRPAISGDVFFLPDLQQAIHVDCVFPVLHGATVEDGTMQGLLTLLNVPYVGCDVVGAALSMEKHLSKVLAKEADVPVVPWVLLSDGDEPTYENVCDKLGSSTLFVKTVSSGSSLGVYRVSSAAEFKVALKEAYTVDRHVIVEKSVIARELEVSVMGNLKPQATPPGEVVVHDEFYSYEAKYFNPDAAEVNSPADVSDNLSATLQEMALRVFRALRCQGLARVDFLVVSDDEIYFNEINPMPGFTNISMFPKSWAAQGVDYQTLLTRLIDLSMDAFERRQAQQQHISQLVQTKHEQYHAE